MAWRICLWDDETIDHVSQHGVSQDDFEFVLANPIREGITRRTGRPYAEGFSADGRWLFCVYEEIDETYVRPVTAYEVEG